MRRRRRLSVLGATLLLVAGMMVASAPPAFAQYGGCEIGQDQAWLNAWFRGNDEQELKHLYMMIDCYLDQPPGEGQ